jgi:peptidyl-prolyl cis-trans isomerase C
MHSRPALSALALSIALGGVEGAAGGTSSPGSSPTSSPGESARRSAVVVRIGEREVTVGEVESRLAAVPRFQLSTMGDTADAIRRKFLVEVIVPEVLLAIGAEKQHIDQDGVVRHNIERALANATMRAIKGQIDPPDSIPMDQIRKYYTENASKFDTPERFAVWRILCATREDALAVIDAAKASLTVDTFTKLARQHSIDKATSMRAGNLGFVDREGNSNEAGLKVDPAIAKAAASVKDGQLVLTPVLEGQGFAVVWHRGTVAAVRRTTEEAAPQIREAIYRERVDDADQGLIAQLRSQRLTEFNDSVLNGIEVSSTDGEVVPRRRPGQVSPSQPLGRALPSKPQ